MIEALPILMGLVAVFVAWFARQIAAAEEQNFKDEIEDFKKFMEERKRKK